MTMATNNVEGQEENSSIRVQHNMVTTHLCKFKHASTVFSVIGFVVMLVLSWEVQFEYYRRCCWYYYYCYLLILPLPILLVKKDDDKDQQYTHLWMIISEAIPTTMTTIQTANLKLANRLTIIRALSDQISQQQDGYSYLFCIGNAVKRP